MKMGHYTKRGTLLNQRSCGALLHSSNASLIFKGDTTESGIVSFQLDPESSMPLCLCAYAPVIGCQFRLTVVGYRYSDPSRVSLGASLPLCLPSVPWRLGASYTVISYRLSVFSSFTSLLCAFVPLCLCASLPLCHSWPRPGIQGS